MSQPSAASRELMLARKSPPLQWRGVRQWQKLLGTRTELRPATSCRALLVAIVLGPATGRADAPSDFHVHVGRWTGAADPKAVVELPVRGRIEKTIPLSAK